MREIKFRGKRIDNGQFVYGDFVKSQDGNKDIAYIKQYQKPYEMVDPETVGQLIDLPDTRNREFYEGDIITVGYSKDPKVTVDILWHRDHYVLCKNGVHLFNLSIPSTDSMEIIGNIHEESRC